jgi:hypothetical protein
MPKMEPEMVIEKAIRRTCFQSRQATQAQNSAAITKKK